MHHYGMKRPLWTIDMEEHFVQNFAKTFDLFFFFKKKTAFQLN